MALKFNNIYVNAHSQNENCVFIIKLPGNKCKLRDVGDKNGDIGKANKNSATIKTERKIIIYLFLIAELGLDESKFK